MKKEFLFAMIAAVLLAGCNSDIFMEDPGVPEKDIAIAGDGGQWTCVIPTAGLRGIFVDYPEQEKQYVQCRDENGYHVAPDSGGRIVEIFYYNPLTSYTISLSEQMIYVWSEFSSVTCSFTIRLNYEDGMKGFIHVTIQAGEPLKFLYEMREGDLEIASEPTQTVFSRSLTNNTSLPQTLEVRPYEMSDAFVRVTPSERWARDLTADLGVPYFNGTEWNFAYRHDVILGQIYEFTPEEPYTERIVSIEVPAGKKALVKCAVSYERVRQKAVLKFSSKTQGCDWDAECEMVARYPVSYEYEVHYE